MEALDINSDQTAPWVAQSVTLGSAVGNVSGNRYKSDCRSRGREFDPGLVPYFQGD